jgi:endonuclease G, mitochondrial
MAQFRQNHAKQGKGLQTTFRLVMLLILITALLMGGIWYLNKKLTYQPTKSVDVFGPNNETARTYLPSHAGELVHHTHYSISYIEAHEQAEWTAYMMDRNMLNAPNVPRHKEFYEDPLVTTHSARHNDYSGSGYTRGHMVPAGDMAFDEVAMRETFYMSNMSPQLRQFNNGVWKELEENIRDWTYKAETLYVVTGPILSNPIKSIGKSSKVTVPSAFYKVLLDYKNKKAIGFIIPHEMTDKPLQDFMVAIDDIEKATSIDFFESMFSDTEEEKLESTFDPSLWNVSEKRYQLRVSKWNYE